MFSRYTWQRLSLGLNWHVHSELAAERKRCVHLSLGDKSLWGRVSLWCQETFLLRHAPGKLLLLHLFISFFYVIVIFLFPCTHTNMGNTDIQHIHPKLINLYNLLNCLKIILLPILTPIKTLLEVTVLHFNDREFFGVLFSNCKNWLVTCCYQCSEECSFLKLKKLLKRN